MCIIVRGEQTNRTGTEVKSEKLRYITKLLN